MVLAATDELARFFRESTEEFAGTILRLARAIVDGRISSEKARETLEDRIVQTMTLAQLYGRRRVLLEVDAKAGGKGWAAMSDQIMPSVPYLDAINALLDREPRLGSTWREVAEAYRNGPAFAAVRSASLQVTERVQMAISNLQQQGRALATSTEVLAEMADWTRAYAETVYRTNAATAYMDGRREESQKPLVRQRMPAWEFFDAEDGDVRPNHHAAHGLIADTQDPIWRVAAPPLGYQCRCQVRLLDVEELAQMGLLAADGSVIRRFPPRWSEFHPDEGFGRAY